MLEFAWPLAALAGVLPWLVARLAPPAPPLAAPLRVPFLREARKWQQAAGMAGSRLRHALAIAAWLALVAAACRPQWVDAPAGVPASGRSMLLALDLSGSIRDVVMGGVSGLEVLRRTARAFIAGRAGDRVGLVVFGTKAYVQSPPTFDLQALAEMVDEAFIGLAGESTALGDAIALGVSRLRTQPDAERVLILITDGSSTEGMAVADAALLARQYGVRVHAIGIGAPLPDTARRTGEGLDEAALQLVAARTGGLYFRADTGAALERVYEALARYEPVAGELRRYQRHAELYVWPLSLALALALTALAASAWVTPARRT
jgi:Ca-activated chloride channel family protein